MFCQRSEEAQRGCVQSEVKHHERDTHRNGVCICMSGFVKPCIRSPVTNDMKLFIGGDPEEL